MAVDLAKLVARLELQSAQFQAELEKANKKLSKFSDDSEKRFKKIAGGFKAAIAGLGLGIGFSAIIENTANAAREQALLENALNANAGAAGQTSQSLKAMADELSSMTTLSGGAVKQMQALLLRFREIGGPEFKRAQHAIADVSAALGLDLNTAAKTVGRALADPEKGMSALAKMGVVLSDSQRKVVKDLVETGRRAEAQQLLLGELEKRYGGAAEAARDNFAGALQSVKNAFNDLLEAKSGLPAATSALNDFADALRAAETQEAADSIMSGLVSALSAVGKVAGAALKPMSDFINAAGDLGARIDNKLFDRPFTPAEMDRMFGVPSKGHGPIRPRAGSSGPDPEPSGPDEDALAAIEKLTANLRQQIATYDQSAVAAMRYRITQGDLADEFAKLGSKAKPLTDELLNLTARYEQLQKATESRKAAEELQKMTSDLQMQIDLYGQGEAAVMRYRIEHGDLAATFATAGAAAEPYKQQLIDLTQQMEDMKEAAEQAAKEARTMDEALARGDALTRAVRTEQEEYADTLRELNDLLFEGAISQETYGRALEQAQKKLDEATNKWTVFKDQAARNTQDIIADTLVNGFDNGAKGILKAFGDMIVQLTAQAVAADIAGKLFGSSAGGEGGGWIGAAMSLFSGFGGARANGGNVSPNQAYVVGERGPEMFVPNTAGKIVPNHEMGGARVTNHFTIQAPAGTVSRQTEMQIAAAAARGVAQANRRNN